MLVKIFWIIRAFIYRILFGIKFIYLGKTCVFTGIKRVKSEEGLGIYPGARIEVGKNGFISFGQNVRIGNNFFCQTNSSIYFGNNVTVSANVFIGTTDYHWREKSEVRLKYRPEIEREIKIEDNVFIGFGAAILPGTRIGTGSVIGANAVVKNHVEPYSIVK